MDRRLNWITLSLTAAATVLFSSAAQGQYAVGSNSSDCGCGGAAYGGYPAASDCGGSCGGSCGGCGIGNGQVKAHIDHLKQINRRAYERNRAWPKPFACADRQLNFAIWNTFFEQGFRSNCVFTAEHFDPETNLLNQAGQAKVQGIFRNNPRGQKMALVQNSAAGHVVDARLDSLQSTIDEWYGNGSFMEVALTDQYSAGFSASRIQAINQLGLDATPPPIIPVASGTGSTSDSNVGQ